MAIHIPERNYYTFDELVKRWDCSNDELCFVIISGDLKPCVRINTEVFEQRWVKDKYLRLAAERTKTSDGNDIKYRPEGWFYVQEPIQTHPFECEFSLVSDDRDPEKENFSFMPTTWFKLPAPLSISDIRRVGVFLAMEIARYEALHGEAHSKSKSFEKVGTRERETLLKLVIGMAIRGYGYDVAASRSDVPREISSDLAAIDVLLTDETVRKYLKEAAQLVLPKK